MTQHAKSTSSGLILVCWVCGRPIEITAAAPAFFMGYPRRDEPQDYASRPHCADCAKDARRQRES